MADTIKSNMEHSNGTTEVKVLDGAGSNIIYTVISITICNTHATNDETFDLFINDVDDTFGGGANDNFYIYKTQSLPALATFEHTSKISLKHNEELVFVQASAGTDVDILVSYLEQT